MGTRTLLTTVAVACALAVTPNVRGADVTSRPSGVAEADWIVLGEGLGFVIEHEGTSGKDRSVEGHFMVRHGADWWRLVETGGGTPLQPVAACPTSRSKEKAKEVPAVPPRMQPPNLLF